MFIIFKIFIIINFIIIIIIIICLQGKGVESNTSVFLKIIS